MIGECCATSSSSEKGSSNASVRARAASSRAAIDALRSAVTPARVMSREV